MNNQDIERLINIEANKQDYGDGFLTGAHYVLNNFMPKWVSVEDDITDGELLRRATSYLSVIVIVRTHDGNITLADFDYDDMLFRDHKKRDVVDAKEWMYIPQPPNE